MSLRKWSASHPELSPSKNDYDFSSADETETLGVIWRPSEDCYTFKISVDENNTFTKRSVLSTIAKIFDPLGIADPVIAKAKIFMRKLNIDWGDPLPAAESQEWSEFISTLKGVNNIKVDRCITIKQSKTFEFHGFADSSESCYGAVVYCKSLNSAGDINVKLVASKSRVAPLKALSIPRLELCAAVLLSKLMKKILSALKLQTDKVYLWSDSMIVLAWIQKEPTSLKTFVKNRIALIQELTLKSQWNHVPSEMNPADLISRGLDPVKLLETNLWWKGPNFLYDNEYPNQNFPVSQELSVFQSELKKPSSLDVEDPLKAFTLTSNNFVHELIGLRSSGPLSNEEINASERFLLRVIQNEQFGSEIRSLKLHGKVSPTSKIRNLNPLLDSNGVLRVGGRLGNTELNFLKKHPAILPKNSPLTSVIISTYHLKYLHIGPNGLLNCVREKVWPLCGRSLCRRITHNCVVCVKNKPIAATQIMGNLPRERVVPDFAFICSGVDLTGPFFIKCKQQRKAISLKVYICLFICFVSKAVHIEIVSDLTSESLIATLKRFIARRGKCAKLFSDNATNFVGANKELKKCLNLFKNPDEKLANYQSAEGIEWSFIPPRAPNFGGLWGAAIKSFKYHFKRAVGNASLTYEELHTIATQNESILNSRPITPLSADETDLEVLTPAHFLIGRTMNAIIELELTNLKENRLSRWQRITKLVQLIWRKWQRSYLSELQQRGKWRFEKDNVKIGSLVLIIEDNLPANKWLMGEYLKCFMALIRKSEL
nr:uncharacterized protein LOC122273148 [Parasteatoda tepidariorum]